jgi:SAM-dependent methyltransferase
VFADLTKRLPLDDASAGTVVSFQVMEHLAEPRTFLQECHRLLRPEGRLHLTVPFMWRVHEAPHDFYRYTPYGLEHLLAKAGFTEVSVQPYAGFWTTVVLKFNYHTLRFAPGPLAVAWAPLWLAGQWLAPLFDRLDPAPEEATGYVVSARKPS